MDQLDGGPAERGNEGPGPMGAGPADPSWTIGPYRVLSILGEGGFGVVYLAEQREPVRRRVAVKVVKPGMDSRGVMARFQQERQSLAVMDHPNVARMHDAGTTSDGRPYFVMEYVDGEPLLEYCDRWKLGLRERLGLFAAVCDGVQHAHTKGVIHRDLKPANILVETGAGEPVVKVIDFGIAKALEQGLGEQTVFTEQGVLIGTPDYMSPEQASLGAVDVDTRTDVYSLGVALYQLLTGALPFDPWALRARGFDEIRRTIREESPHRPGARLAELGEEAEAIAALRGLKLSELRDALRKELEWIPLKAMRKDRDERYATARDMAEDVRRYLGGRALKAGPESALYRARKFVRRNRGKVVATTALGVALAAGAVVSTTFAVREGRQRRAAEVHLGMAEKALERAEAAEEAARRRAEELAQMTAFQEGQLSGIDPERLGNQIRKQIFDKRRVFLESENNHGPELERWLAELERGLTGVNFFDVGRAVLDQEIFDRAIASADREFAHQPLLRARMFQTLATTMVELGLLYEATVPQGEALTIRRVALGSDHADTLFSIDSAAMLLQEQGRLEEAEDLAREALERRRRTLGADAPDTLLSLDHLGGVLQALGRLPEAEVLFREAIAGSRRILGDRDPQTLRSINNMGGLLQARGRLLEAEPLLREALAGRRDALGEEHPDTLNSLSNMGSLLYAMGRLDEAEVFWSEALSRRKRVLGSEHPETLRSINNMGGLLNERGQFEAALALLEPGEAAARRVWSGANLHWLGNYMAKLGEARAGVKMFEPAELNLLEAYALLSEGFGSKHIRTETCKSRIVALYEAWDEAEPGAGHDTQAAVWRAPTDDGGADAP